MKSKKIVTNEAFCYKNKNPIVNFYFNNLLISAINMSRFWKSNSSIILDFGCNSQQLKKLLKRWKVSFTYIGYDLDEKYSDINDYNLIKPDYIFCINVLEHLTIDDLLKTLNNFKNMNKNVKIITAIPGKNFLSNFLNHNVSDKINWEHKELQVHKTNFLQLQKILSENCILLKTLDYMFIQRIQLWKFRL